MKKINFIGNIILSFFMRLFFSCSIIDSQSGAWVSNNRLLKEMHLVSNGMSLSEEIKIEAVKSPAIKFREIPIQYKNRIGDSKLNIWRDGISNLLFLFIKRFRPKRGVHGR